MRWPATKDSSVYQIRPKEETVRRLANIIGALTFGAFVVIRIHPGSASALIAHASAPPASSTRDGSSLYGNKDKYLTGSPPVMTVCWVNPGTVTAQRREWVRETIEQNWTRYARVNFTEWDTCTSAEGGVRITIQDGQPATPDGRNMTLNLLYNTAGPAGCLTNDSAREHCARAVAVHEFGHVLGFYHEEERDDYTAPRGVAPGDPCAKQSFANSNKRLYGAVDLQSVMSYCGQPFSTPSTWKENLSPGDIAGVQRAYGRRIAGSLVSSRGNCVAAHAEAGDGAPVFVWGCDEAKDDQEWIRAIGGTLRLAPNRCMHASAAAGATVGLYTCTVASPAWQFEQVQLRGWGGLCLDLKGGSTTPGNGVQLWDCSAYGGQNQRWTIVGAQIKYGAAGSAHCLTASGATNGAAMVIQPCAQTTSQYFTFLPGGEIRPQSGTNLCLDARAVTDSDYLAGNGLPANGAAVQAYSCLTNQLNQKWNLSGSIKLSGTNLCLERAGSSHAWGTRLQVGTCASVQAQYWDYYFK